MINMYQWKTYITLRWSCLSRDQCLNSQVFETTTAITIDILGPDGFHAAGAGASNEASPETQAGRGRWRDGSHRVSQGQHLVAQHRMKITGPFWEEGEDRIG